MSVANEPGLLVLQSSTQNWSSIDPPGFFRHLHLALCQGLGLGIPVRPFERFEAVRDLIRDLARQYRFVIVLDEFGRLAGNERLGQDFFANLRTLGYEAGYRLGYLAASRRPLEQLCREHRIEESSFWNIFGIPQVLGLLADDEARTLIEVPVRECLGQEIDPGPVLELTGSHPALIQMVMFEQFEAIRVGCEPDWQRLRTGLRAYYRDLWNRRSPEEQTCLQNLSAGRPAGPEGLWRSFGNAACSPPPATCSPQSSPVLYVSWQASRTIDLRRRSRTCRPSSTTS